MHYILYTIIYYTNFPLDPSNKFFDIREASPFYPRAFLLSRRKRGLESPEVWKIGPAWALAIWGDLGLMAWSMGNSHRKTMGKWR